jgi:hypothetical protein
LECVYLNFEVFDWDGNSETDSKYDIKKNSKYASPLIRRFRPLL